MAMNVKEIKSWLETLSDLDEVGVDDGGLCLRSVQHPNVWCEIGGLPEEKDEEIENCDNCLHADEPPKHPNCAECLNGGDGWEGK